MSILLEQKNKLSLSIHLILLTVLLLLYSLNFTQIINISDEVLIFVVLIIFLWIYFSAGYIGIEFYHPYRLFLLIFFLYNVGGFVFSLFKGIDFFELPFGYYSSSIFTKFVHTETLFSILFFMIFFHLGVLIYLQYNVKPLLNEFTWEEKTKIFSTKAGLILFYITLLPAYFYIFTVIKEAYLLGGYQNYAFSDIEGTTNLPFIIRISYHIFIFGFWLYLSTIPEKKKLIIPTILYFLPFLLMSFFTGSRVHAIVPGVTLLTYFAAVKYLNAKNTIVLLSIFVLFSTFIGILRGTQDYDFGSVKTIINEEENNPIEDFFLAQGGSALTISLTIVLIESNKIDYSLRYLVEPLYRKNGYQPQKRGDDYFLLSDRLSYYFTENFESGGGLGSSIVAEFYAIGGILGVLVLSFIFGFSLFWLISKIHSPTEFLFFLLLLPGFYFTPRGHPFNSLIFAEQQIIILLCFLFFKKLIAKDI
jgi:oligosaccharide repeat unit polymerase